MATYRSVLLGMGLFMLSIPSAWSQVPSSFEQPESSGSGAQNATPAELKEVIVTSEKITANLQSVPVAVTALDTLALETADIRTTKDLAAAVPSLFIPSESPSGASNAIVFMRGIGTDNTQVTTDPAIGIYVDGVYYASSYGTILNLFDLDRVEVLRGPQGTLYGRNNSVGAIRLITKDPLLDGTDFTARAGVGAYGDTNEAVSFSTPLIDNQLGIRITATHEQNNGVQHNLLDPTDFAQSIDTTVLRTSLLWAPLDNLKVTLRYDDTSDRGAAVQAIPEDQTNQTVFSTNLKNLNQVEHRGGSATLEWSITPDVHLTVISSARDLHFDDIYDLDGAPTLQFEVQPLIDRIAYWTDEAYLTGTTAWAMPLKWVAGAFYFDQAISETETVNFGPGVLSPALDFPIVSTADRRLNSKSYAAYAQGTLAITSALDVTGGYRWTQDQKVYQEFLPPTLYGSFKADNNTWKIGGDYRVSENVFTYVSVGTGFRSGGFDINSGQEFPTEVAKTYEAGIKTDWFNRRLRVNADYFYTLFTNLQQAVDATSNDFGFATVTLNARSQGLEFEASAIPVDGLTLSLSVATLKSLITEPALRSLDLSLKESPDLTYRPSVLYQIPLSNRTTFQLGADYAYTAAYNTSTIAIPQTAIGASGEFNARAALLVDKWTFALSGRNLTNEDVAPFKFYFAYPGLTNQITKYPRTPRTWMLDATYRIGK